MHLYTVRNLNLTVRIIYFIKLVIVVVARSGKPIVGDLYSNTVKTTHLHKVLQLNVNN